MFPYILDSQNVYFILFAWGHPENNNYGQQRNSVDQDLNEYNISLSPLISVDIKKCMLTRDLGHCSHTFLHFFFATETGPTLEHYLFFQNIISLSKFVKGA